MTQRTKRGGQTQVNPNPSGGQTQVNPNPSAGQTQVGPSAPRPNVTVAPLKPGKFGSGVHEFNTHNARIAGGTPVEVLTDGRFWSHVARKLTVGDEIRALAEDCSFRALLLVSYVRGTEVVVKLLAFTEVDAVDYDALNNVDSGYRLSEKGTLGWCIVKNTTGEIVKEGFANQALAARALTDYLKAMAA